MPSPASTFARRACGPQGRASHPRCRAAPRPDDGQCRAGSARTAAGRRGAGQRHRRRNAAPPARSRRADRRRDAATTARRQQGADGAAPGAWRRKSALARPIMRWSRPRCRWSTAGRDGWSTACWARCFAKGCRQSTRPACRKRSKSAGASAWGDDVVAAARRAIAHRPPLDLSFASDEACAAYSEGISLAPRHRRLDHAGAVTELPGFGRGPMVGPGSCRLASRTAGSGRRRQRARRLRCAGRQDHAACRGRP